MLLILALLSVCAVDASFVKPLHKHHQFSTKMSPLRWMKRSDERREKLGLPKWIRNQKDMSLRQQKGKSNSLPTEGDLWPVAIYWSFLEVGTPGQEFPVAIDSGSFTLDIPLKGCQGCVHQAPNNVFDPAASSSSHLFKCSVFSGCHVEGAHCEHDTCSFSNTYETCVPTDPTQPCTISGPFYSDVVAWGTNSTAPITFGAIDYQTSNFEQFQNIDGVCGMAGPGGAQSVVSSLAAHGAIPERLWSICLKDGAVSNGTITIGGIDSRLHNGEVQYTPDVGGGEFYEMQMEGLSVGTTSIQLDQQQVIIDSGTNILLLDQTSFSSMKQAFLAMCSQVHLHGICDVQQDQTLFDNVCMDFTQEQINQFPNITIAVEGLKLTMNPNNYILLNYGVNFKPGQSCLGIDNTGPGGLFIVGDTLLENYLTVFDLANNRIGWAPVSEQCGNIQ